MHFGSYIYILAMRMMFFAVLLFGVVGGVQGM